MLRDFLAVRQLNCDEIINDDDDEEDWADPKEPCGGWSHPGDGNHNAEGYGEEDIHGDEKWTGKVQGTKDGTGKGKATEDGNGKGKAMWKANGKVKGFVVQSPGGDDISCAIALQLQKAISEANLDMEG
jgi:hypothetical protein